VPEREYVDDVVVGSIVQVVVTAPQVDASAPWDTCTSHWSPKMRLNGEKVQYVF